MLPHSNLKLLLLAMTGMALWSCEKKQPNLVFILVDDLGWSDVGYNGSDFYETPNIDQLSEQSVLFTNAYASGSVCSPSRAAILTGKHPSRLHITDWIPGQNPANRALKTPSILNQLPLEEVTLAEKLKEVGYQTFFAGKWHLGDEGFFPEQQGFMTNLGGHHKGSPPGGYYSPYKNPKLTDGPEGEYLTDRLTTEAINFLEQSGTDPFFLYLNYYTVHTPIQPNIDFVDRFETKLETIGRKTESSRTEGSGTTNLEQRNAAYASMLFALDKNIGRLVKQLKDAGLYDDTILIFTSDNGGLSTLENGRIAPTSVLPLRGGKGWLYEGGIRVPLLIKPRDFEEIGRQVNDPVIGHDFFPTILSMIGIESTIQFDGVDITPALNGEQLARKELFWHYPHYHGSAWTPGAAIRQHQWKLISFYETNTIELYDLSEDLEERKDLSKAREDIVESLSERLDEMLASVQADSVTINEAYQSRQ
ncbi:MAG: sulfatase [Cyclobacteriaceae bacterium]